MEAERSRKRKACDILKVREKADTIPTSIITFSERDIRHEPPKHDEPIVILVVVTEYKVERVLIDQGSLANILYWSTYKKLGFRETGVKTDRHGALRWRTIWICGRTGRDKRTWIPHSESAAMREPSRCHSRSSTTVEQVGSSSLHISPMHEVPCWKGGRKSMGGSQHCQVMLQRQPKSWVPAIPGQRYRCECPRPRPRSQVRRQVRETSPDGRFEGGPDHKMKVGTALAQEDEDRLIHFLWKTRMSSLGPQLYAQNSYAIISQYPRVSDWSLKDRGSWGTKSGERPGKKRKSALDKIHQRNTIPDMPSKHGDVDGASGFALLSFMDAYSGYNQIKMHPRDKAKIAFITDVGAYCYKVMPFGLKNVGATY
ncbi:hypothetical protein CR513_01171, partial [Mucuna pruriens]